MKIILLKNVAKIGQRGDVREVADGYALNMLIPHGHAERATQQKIAEIERQKELRKNQSEHATKTIEGQIKGLIGRQVILRVPSNKKGILYEKLDAQKISALAPTIPFECIRLDRPIKEIGEYEIELVCGSTKGVVLLLVESVEEVG